MQIRNLNLRPPVHYFFVFVWILKATFIFFIDFGARHRTQKKGIFVSSFVTFTLLAKHTGVLDFGCQRFPLNCKSLFLAREQFLLTIIRLCF